MTYDRDTEEQMRAAAVYRRAVRAEAEAAQERGEAVAWALLLLAGLCALALLAWATS